MRTTSPSEALHDCGARRPSTVAEKVCSLLAGEEAPIVARCHDVVGGSFSEYELDLLDWGLVFGMSYALTRIEEPCETARSAAWRAKEAAIAAFAAWGGGVESIKAPDLDALVEAVVRAARAVERHKLPEPLEDALDDLLNGVGGAA